MITYHLYFQIDGLVQERRDPGALAMELRLSCINPGMKSRKTRRDFSKSALHWENMEIME